MLTFEATFPNKSGTGTEQVLGCLPQPLIVVQPDRRLLFGNCVTEGLFADGRASKTANRLMSLGQLHAQEIEEVLQQASFGGLIQIGLWFQPTMQTGWLAVSRADPVLTKGADWASDSLLMLVHLDAPHLSQTARIDAMTHQCKLTPTERYVLLLLADGQAVESAARQLGLQISTLRSHVRNLLGKTNAPTLMQLMRWVGSSESAARFEMTSPARSTVNAATMIQ